MRLRRYGARIFGILVAVSGLLVAPPRGAQAQALPDPGGVTREESTTTDPLGHRVVVERTLVDGHVVREEVKVTSSAGQLLSAVETVFDPRTGQPVARETVAVAGGTVTTVEQKFQNGQVVAMETKTVTVANGRQVTVEREFALVGGVLTEVRHERTAEAVGHGDSPSASEERAANRDREAERSHEAGETRGGEGPERGEDRH
jgi:hypothetical protein